MEQLKLSDLPAQRAGLIIIFITFVVFGGWASFAPLSSAVLAPGVLVVKDYRKTIQHLEGGIVSDIKVNDGDLIKAGEVLLALDDTQFRAEREIVRSQLVALSMMEKRLLAERDGLLTFPEMEDDGDPRSESSYLDERAIFETRHHQRMVEKSVLEQQFFQLDEQINGLNMLVKSKRQLQRSYQGEISELKVLLADGFIDKMRMRDMQRKLTELEGEITENLSNIAQAKVKQGEIKLGLLQLDNQFGSEVADQLAQVRSRINDLRERLTALDHKLERTLVRAPVTGKVLGMSVHTLGGVIRPGEEILDIVPQSGSLVVEARVSTSDIDRIVVGQTADVRFSAFNAGFTPRVTGEVTHVSADRLKEPETGISYYHLRVALTDSNLTEEVSGLRLIPGMPVEVLVNSGERTLLQYLMQPATNAFSRALIED